MPKTSAAKVDQLMAMGFPKEAVEKALADKAGNVEAAMETLLTGM